MDRTPQPAAQQELPLGAGRLRFRHTAAYAELAAAIGDEVRHPPMEQSNTGVFFGNRLYLKGYRRLQGGPSPEVEVGNFLTATVPFKHVSRVAGWVDYVGADGVPATLALLQEYVEHQGNLWDYTLEYLDRYVDLRAGAGVGPPVPAEEDLHQGFVAMAAILGKRIGQLHGAFATASGNPDFDPEPVTRRETESWRAAVRADLERTLGLLAARRSALDAGAGAAADQLLANRDRLERLVASLPLAAEGLVKTRYHGDLHLAQVLVVQNDFVIIDFEGEPGRPVAERRRKHSPLRDVAGMIRSADYVARTAIARRAEVRSDDATVATELFRDWRVAVTGAFLVGYRDAARELPSVPRDDAVTDGLIRLFTIEKALYEVRYELDNRPDWVQVPLDGLLELLRAAWSDHADLLQTPVDGLAGLWNAMRAGPK